MSYWGRGDFVAFTALLCLLCGAAVAAPLVVVEDGQPRATVVAAAGAEEAARELVYYIRKATGATLPMSASGMPRIVVGAGKTPRDGYGIRIEKGALLLDGDPSFAVYAFLQRFLGIRWLWPGEIGEVVPQTRNLKVDTPDIREEPAFLWRDLGPGGALWGPLDKWAAERKLGITEEHQRIERLWEKRNGFGGLRIFGGHAFGEILPPAKYGSTHPEYFALVGGKRDSGPGDGKHRNQPCTTNPDVIRITTEFCRRFFDTHPDYDAFSISLNDGRGFCECDRCRRLDTGEKQTEAGDPETGRAGSYPVITDRIVTFANEVAEAVRQTHPDKKLVLFAYGPYKQPPKRVKAAGNLIIQYTMHASSHWDRGARDKELRELAAWAGAAKHLAIYEYLVQGATADLPRIMPVLIQDSVRKIHDLGFRYYQTQAGDGYALCGLNYYVLSKLLWNPAADVRAIERDYFEKGFEKAAPAVMRYFDRLADRWKEVKSKGLMMDRATPDQYEGVRAVYPTEFRTVLRQDLAEARRVATGDDRKRVEFIQRGFEYLDLTLRAVETKSMRLWEERDRTIESQKNDFTLAHLWIRYNDQERSFNPLRAVSRIESAFFAAPPLPELRPQTHGRFEPAPGVIAERVTYGTQFGMRIPAILYLPKSHTAKVPGLILVNGHGGDKYSWYSFYTGILYAKAGAAVLTYDPAGEGERNIERRSGSRAHDKVEPPPELAQRLAGLMITDARQAAAYLAQRPEVDAGRIAAMGYSLGSFVLSLTCALETKLNSCVLAGGGNLDGDGGYWDRTKQMCVGIPYKSLSFLGDRPAALYWLHSLRGYTLVYNGRGDNVVNVHNTHEPFFEDLRRRVLQRPAAPERVFEFAFDEEVTASHRPWWVTGPVALWLEKRLDFPNWTEATIRALPKVRIGDWAAANHVAIDPLYDTAEREAGTMALDVHVPPLSRADLSVFPAAEWERQKESMIHEAWLKNAKARLAQ